MLLQIGAFLGQIGQTLLSSGLEIGTAFLNRELGRSARRDEKERIKAMARAAGSSPSFTTPVSPGALSSGFLPPTPVQLLPGGIPGLPDVFGRVPGVIAERQRFLNGNGSSLTNIPNGLAPGFSRFTRGFVLGSEGCLRPTMPGEKAQFRQKADGSFVRARPRRMNPLNIRAFRRAERRVKSLERICRSVFTEARKAKTGAVRRKTSRRRKKS